MRPTAASFLPPHLRGRSSPMSAGAPETPDSAMRERRPHLSESFVRATEDGGSKEERSIRLTQLLQAIPANIVTSPMQTPRSTLDSPLSERCNALNKTYNKLRDAVHGLENDEEDADADLDSAIYTGTQTHGDGVNDRDSNTKEEMKKLGSILLDHDTSLVQLTEHVKTHELENQHLLQQVRSLTISSEKNASMLQFFKNGLADLLSGMEFANAHHANGEDDTLVGSSPSTKHLSRNNGDTHKHDSNGTNDFFLQKSAELNYENMLDQVQVLSEKFKKMEGRFNTQKLDLDAINLKATSNVLEQQIPILYQRLEELAAQIGKAHRSSGQGISSREPNTIEWNTADLNTTNLNTADVEDLAVRMRKLEIKTSTIRTMSTANEEDLAVRINNLEIKVASLVKKNCHPSYPDN